jgi:hypothetical protein
MKGAIRLAALAWVLLVAPAAWGQEPAAPPAPPAPDVRWERYHAAFDALARGDLDRARELLGGLAEGRSGHPAEQRAAEVLYALDRAPALAEPEVVDVRAPEQPSKLARAELAMWQTIMGVAVGVEICLMLECDDATVGAGMVALGAGGALGFSLGGTRDGVTSGTRAIWNSGASWGFWNGIALAFILEENDDLELEVSEFGAVMLGGQAAGYATAAIVTAGFEPTGGQVALANTVGIWSGVLTFLAMQAFDVDPSDGAYLQAALVASDVGLLGGAFLARVVPMSRARTLLIDAGGVLGLLAGFGTAVLIGGEDLDEDVGFAAAFGGVSVGLAGAAFLTRSWDAPSPPARVTIIPARGGGMLGVAFDL